MEHLFKTLYFMEHLQVTASSMVSFKRLLKITILDSLKMARINEWLLFFKKHFRNTSSSWKNCKMLSVAAKFTFIYVRFDCNSAALCFEVISILKIVCQAAYFK